MRSFFIATLLLTTQFFSLSASALAIGDMTVTSALGEPLKARVVLTGIGSLSTDEIKADKADPETYRSLGVEVVAEFQQLHFLVVQEGRDYVVKITSETPVREPYIEFILEVKWPNGQVYKAFSAFIDPRP